jgi:hypothetical protein
MFADAILGKKLIVLLNLALKKKLKKITKNTQKMCLNLKKNKKA